jgi:hypothetical protein
MMNSLRNFFCVPSCQTANKGDCLYTCFVYFKISSFPILMHLWFQNGILKGEVSLYCWPTVWLVWNQLYDYWQFWFLFAKQTNPSQSNRRSMVQWYSSLVFPCFSMELVCSKIRIYIVVFVTREFRSLWKVCFGHGCLNCAVPLKHSMDEL